MTGRRALAAAAAVALAVTCAAAAGLAWTWRTLSRPVADWPGRTVDVVLEPGLDAGSVLQRLADAGVLRRPRLVRLWLACRGGAERLHAGEYRFDRPISALEVLARLRQGDVLLHPVTLPEGLTMSEVAGRLGAAGLGSRESFLAAFSDPAAIRDLDPEATDLEGYLFPDTYHFSRHQRPDIIADALVRRFREAVGPAYRERADRAGLGLRQAVTLASMIEKETALDEERARISGVFHNRLKRGMRLECDPTVIYALERAGRPVGRLSRAHLQFVSPWNTYVVSGLPAGPIANPGRASLLAAVEPLEGDELFFVAAPGGGHRFSDDLPSHRQAVAQWRHYVRSSR
jgi:UPF0755 protein